MPHIGAQKVDAIGVQLIGDWIRSLPKSTEASLDWTDAQIRESLATPEATLQLALQMHAQQISTDASERIVKVALERVNEVNATLESMHIRDLLEPFFPESARKERLGVDFDPAKVISLVGDAERGRTVFRTESLRCVACHAVDDAGGELGPPLDEIGRKYQTPEAMLETLVKPSSKIAPEYSGWSIVTTDGQMLTGRIVRELSDELVLWTLDGERTIKYDDIEVSSEASTSMMPTQLLQSLSSQEAADLLAYLQSLRGG